MVEKTQKDESALKEAAALLSAASEQLREINRAVASGGANPDLQAASERAREVMSEIKSAMSSGHIDASTLASLSASLNIGVDASSAGKDGGNPYVMAGARLAVAEIESRATVQRMASDLFDKHEFDADVARHTSGAEFEAYKHREAEDERYIREQLARHTAEGDLNASGRMQRHMLDANAHGAGDNADFMQKWNELKEKTDKLRAAMRAAGKSTAEYDESIRQDVIAFLKAKGLSDEQTKEALAKNENPLDAVKPYLAGDDESRRLVNDIGLSTADSKPKTVKDKNPQGEPLTIDVAAMNARLAEAGLNVGAGAEPAGHGLTIQKPPRKDPISR